MQNVPIIYPVHKELSTNHSTLPLDHREIKRGGNKSFEIKYLAFFGEGSAFGWKICLIFC